MENRKIKFSIKIKLVLLASIGTALFLIVSVYQAISMSNYNKVYDELINNLTVANSYNLTFKADMDESLYQIVVGYVKYGKGNDSAQDPYVRIEEITQDFQMLKLSTGSSESKVWIDSLLRNTKTLYARVDDLLEHVAEGGMYDQNIRELDNNIYILTELIQEDIQYYIYYQTESMEVVKEQLDHQVRNYLILVGFLILLMLAATVVASAFLGGQIIRPINRLYDALGKVAKGDLSVRTEIDSHDEMAVLGKGFNEMAENMEQLIEKVREDEQKMRKADLRLLQEQINPHFLYNTLDAIVWLIEKNEMDEAVDMVVTLSVFFRLVLSKGKEFISIRMEEQHIRSYLQIQEKRYEDILEYHVDIDPELYQYQILKLSLQPIVENALYHGVKNKRAKGIITITGKRLEDAILLTVEDDGVGMEKAELETLRSDIEKPCKETERGFGLANVNERIHMYFGQEYGLSVDSEKGKGTIVSLRIPAIRIAEEIQEARLEE